MISGSPLDPRNLDDFEWAGVSVKGEDDIDVDSFFDRAADDREFGFLWSEKVSEGITSGASGSGPDFSRICPGISVKIELIRASS